MEDFYMKYEQAVVAQNPRVGGGVISVILPGIWCLCFHVSFPTYILFKLWIIQYFTKLPG